jgi:hypothetical protein
MDSKQKKINRMLQKIKCSYSPYSEYGYMLRIPILFVLVVIFCLITPFTNWIIPLVYKRLSNVFMFSIQIKN